MHRGLGSMMLCVVGIPGRKTVVVQCVGLVGSGAVYVGAGEQC